LRAYRIGVDENGLGARLGPLVVTAILSRVTEQGDRLLSRRPPKRLRADLDDSKKLVSHGNVALGEAWARALLRDEALTPAEVVARLSLEGIAHLTEPCLPHVAPQCWSVGAERFVTESEEVRRISGHIAWWAARGVEILAVKTSVVCTKRLNLARAAGGNRFISDLHAMERLVVGLRAQVDSDILAVCGKVGGIDDYSKFFGPLSQGPQGPHSELERGRARSAYHFPKVGEVRFVRDADAKDCLVMLASIVGKYVRELLMARVSDFYRDDTGDVGAASGYHDPVTARFVDATALLRNERRIPGDCFERDRA
jgi:ribonuclease HII